MRTHKLRTHPRGLQCVAIASALILVHCADPPVVPRIPDPDDVALDVRAGWTVTQLQVPRGITESSAHDVNNAGVIVGTVRRPSENGPHAVRWINGVMSYLTEPPGPDPATIVERINNSGVSVGNYHPGFGENEAVRWDAAGQPTVLVGLPGSSSDWAHDINDDGVIVGQSQHHAVRWINGVVEDLHPPGYGKSSATGINTGGDIVGWVEYQMTGVRRSYIWRTNSVQQELGVLAGDGHSEASAINDALTAVGISISSDWSVKRAFRWTSPLGMTAVNLGTPNSFVTGISNFDRVVGYREFQLNGTAYVGAVTRRSADLWYLPSPLYYTRTRAWGVNLCGEIVGTGTNGSGVDRALMWTQASCDP